MLTEDQIERRIERMMDSLDRKFMAGAIDAKTYDSGVADLRKWEEAKYRERAALDRAKLRRLMP